MGEGVVQVSVGKDDRRVLAAEFELELGAGLRGDLAQIGADGVGAGEGDAGDARIADERIADGAGTPCHEVEHARRQAGLGQNLDEADGAERGETGRLEDDGVAEGEGRGDFPGRDRDREVPGGDDPDDAEGLADGVEEGERVHRGVVLAARLLNLAGEVAEDLDGATGLADALLEGLAFLPGEFPPDLLLAGGEDLGGLVEDVGAGDGGGAAPAVGRLGGSGDGGLDVLLGGGGEAADEVIRVGGAAVLEGLAGGGGAPFAADVVAVGLGLAGRGLGCVGWCCHWLGAPRERRCVARVMGRNCSGGGEGEEGVKGEAEWHGGLARMIRRREAVVGGRG